MKYRWSAAGLAWVVLVLVLSACLPERKSGSEDGKESEESAAKVALGASHVLGRRDQEYAVGFTTVTTTTMDAANLAMEVKAGPNIVKGTSSRTARSKVVIQVLGKDRRRVTVQQETIKESFSLQSGHEGEETKKNVLVGQYVLVERTDGVWKARFESGKEASAEEQEAMDNYATWFNKEAEGPEEEVRRIGEEWEDDAGVFGEGTLKWRFVRVEDYQDLPCAVLEGTMRTTQETPDGGVQELEAKVRAYRSLQYGLELYFEVLGTLKGTSYPQLGATAQLSGPMKMAVINKVVLPKGP